MSKSIFKLSTPPLPLGTKTQWGKISAVEFTGGERYYWMIDKHRSVAMMPADVVANQTGVNKCQ